MLLKKKEIKMISFIFYLILKTNLTYKYKI